MKDYQGDFEQNTSTPPYHHQRVMAGLKATALFCGTLLIISGMFLSYTYYAERFMIIGNESGLYIFDRKETHFNHCDKDGSCNSLNLTKSPMELAALQKSFQPTMGGNMLTGFNQPPSTCQAGMPMQPMQPVQGMPMYPMPQENMQMNMMGMGIQRTPPTMATQQQLQAGQQYANASEMMMQQHQMLQPPVQNPIPARTQGNVVPFTPHDTQSHVVHTSAEEHTDTPPYPEPPATEETPAEETPPADTPDTTPTEDTHTTDETSPEEPSDIAPGTGELN